MSSGNDFPIASPRLGRAVTVVGSSSSAQTQRESSATTRVRAMRRSWEKQRFGLERSIQERELPADGHTAGGWRYVAETNENAQIAQGCLVVLALGLGMTLIVLCWTAIFKLLGLL